MKRTEEDRQFGAEFARRLRPLYQEALANGVSEKVFAGRLGVDRGGLQRYLRQEAMPGFRTIVLAYREFGILIPYAGTESIAIVSGRVRRRRTNSDLQMDLPLTIETRQGQVDVVIKKKTARRVTLQVRAVKRG